MVRPASPMPELNTEVARAIAPAREALAALRGVEIPGRATELVNGARGLREALYWLGRIERG